MRGRTTKNYQTMNKKERMYQQIQKHGENLNAIFNTGLEPVKLCKKLHTLELKAHRLATDYCNGENGVTTETIDAHLAPIMKRVRAVLGDESAATGKYYVHFNGDARGYALKIDDKIVRENNLTIYTDWGGYGILAPEFTGE